MLAPSIEHRCRFDAAGKLDADAWVMVPRAALRAEFTLDHQFAEALERMFYRALTESNPLRLKVIEEPQGIRLRAPLGKTALLLYERERIVEAKRVETSWRIAGGFLLAHRVNYGGRLYIGAAWSEDDASLKIYSAIRRYPPRLIGYFGTTRGIPIYERTQGAAYRYVQSHFFKTVLARITQT